MPRKNENIAYAVELARSGATDTYGNVLTLTDIGRMTGVSRKALCNRLEGNTRPSTVSHAHPQALSPGEEATLVAYIDRQAKMGTPPTPAIARQVAELIRQNRLDLDGNGIGSQPVVRHPLGVNWLQGFKRRHPEVNTAWSRAIDRNRFNNSTRERLTPWFTELGKLIKAKNYPAERMFNMDKSGYGIGTTLSKQVLTVSTIEGGRRSARAKIQSVTPGRQEWVTTVECVRADGVLLEPMVIYKGTNVLEQWKPQDEASKARMGGWVWKASKGGWTSNYLSKKWLTECFEPQTAVYDPNDPTKRLPRLLIVDGHGIHVKAAFISHCLLHDIDLVLLVPHTSHIMQPLDVGVFSHMKRAMAQQSDRIGGIPGAGKMAKDEWCRGLLVAREKGGSSEHIKTGFRATGIEPFLPSRVLKHLPDAPRPSTPPPNPLRTPLGMLSANTRSFVNDQAHTLNTPTKRRLTTSADKIERLTAENAILVAQANEYKAAMGAKRARTGAPTPATLGTYHMSQQTVLDTVTAYEKGLEARKDKGKGREVAGPSVVPEDREELVDDFPSGFGE